jgi:F-type H+-transporting ATPase subunit b
MTPLFFAADEAVTAAVQDQSFQGQLHSIAEQFGWNLPQFLSQLFVFCVLSFVLYRYVYRPIILALDERRNTIKDSLDNADRIKAELAAAEATRKEIIQKANEQATALINEAQKTAIAQGERRLQEAITQAEDIIKRAHEATTLDRERMLVELKQELARLVVETTAKVAGKVLTPEDQNRLNEETVRQLASQN